MVDKPLLHELLKEDQEPFHLKSYIANRRSQLKNSTTTLQLRKRRPITIINETQKKRTNLCKHACFFSFHSSPADVRRSPFLDLPSPAKSPCKSPTGAVFLHIPSRTATLLVEAAMRIHKQQQSKPKPHAKNGFGLFGSFLKRLKDRSKNRKRAIEDSDIVRVSQESEAEESLRMSCSCSNRRLSSANWTEINEDKSLDFEASTSSRVSDLSEEIMSDQSCFCESPFRFSLHKSPSSSGRRTPEFSSPAASPTRHVKQEKENYEARNSDNVQGEEEEEKDQCSPVSVLDPPFDEDESCDVEEDDDFDMECSYENVQRAKQQLLYRLRRFEKLAELDPVELERKLLVEGSDEEGREGTDEHEPLSMSPYRQHNVETFVSQVFNQSSLKYHSRSMSADMKRLVSDLIVEEKRQMIQPGANEVVMGRICSRLDSWREVESDTIDMMIGLDFKKELQGWAKFGQEVQETAAEIELAIYLLLLQELTDDLDQKMDMVSS
ncbi:hypothetical protein C2S53_009914 [Perilla frutescens var. hirtella]|uniref:DUF4378 domain-containing protein n=1 Tax=Perilla frutescens var. hirtella TaxID=608512 RepID=A0AAD4P470_PERFH|nr:hypothetical protein C2S53_009914 [Perilla frutescens var. hirtella]